RRGRRPDPRRTPPSAPGMTRLGRGQATADEDLSMPPDPLQNPPPPPTGKPRRRPAPAAGGHRGRLVLPLLLAGIVLGNSMGSAGTIQWSEFYFLLDKKYLAEVSVGTDRISGKVGPEGLQDIQKADPTLYNKLRNGRFTVQRLPINDDSELAEKLNAM